MSISTLVRRRLAAATALIVAVTAACSSERVGVTDPQTPPPADSIAATYKLSSVNEHALPAEVYAGLYQDQETGFFRDLRVVATDGYVHLKSDGTFDQKVTMVVYVDGQLVGRPNYVDHGLWRAIDFSDLVRFESNYNASVEPFHGLAHNRKVWLSQNLTTEQGAQDADYIYVKQ